jgi:hypothetical protein
MDQLNTPDRNFSAITKLTALWAFNESGLGGLMFALKIPLTGFFVGGFAVLLIGLIAWYAQRDYKQVLKATVLVLIIKATVSPHSPPPAYLAVAFQGFAGALIYRYITSFRIASVVLALLAMAESALQKIIVMTLIYGKSIWLALDKLFESISKEFAIHADVSFSLLLIAVYLAVYLVWGLVVGVFSGKLPLQIEARKEEILQWYRQDREMIPVVALHKNRKFRFVIYICILVFILTVFLLGGNNKQQVLFILFRSLAAVLLLFFVLRPILNRLLHYWLSRQRSARKHDTATIIALLPGIRTYVRPSWQLAAKQQSKAKQLKYFIYYMVALTLYEERNERAGLYTEPGYQDGQDHLTV